MLNRRTACVVLFFPRFPHVVDYGIDCGIFGVMRIKFLIAMLLVNSHCYSQEIKKYTAEVDFYNKDSIVTGSGFFIEYKTNTFFITARHALYRDNSNVRFNIDTIHAYFGRVAVYVNPKKAECRCSGLACDDFVIIETDRSTIPKDIILTLFDESKEGFYNDSVFVYGKATGDVPIFIRTKVNFNTKTFFESYLNEGLQDGCSGSPVLVRIKNKVKCLGVYVGVRNLKNGRFGCYVNATNIINLLENRNQ